MFGTEGMVDTDITKPILMSLSFIKIRTKDVQLDA